VRAILAIELLIAANVNYRFHKKMSSGKGLAPVMNLLKRHNMLRIDDRPLADDIESINDLIQSGEIVKIVSRNINVL
jgi:histidine ammonia-lyase